MLYKFNIVNFRNCKGIFNTIANYGITSLIVNANIRLYYGLSIIIKET